MTTREDLKTKVQFGEWCPRDRCAGADVGDTELTTAIEDGLALGWTLIGIDKAAATARRRPMWAVPAKIPSDIRFNIHDLWRALKALPPQDKCTYPLSKWTDITQENAYEFREQLADRLSSAHLHSAHLLTASEVAALLLHVYSLGMQVDKNPKNRYLLVELCGIVEKGGGIRTDDDGYQYVCVNTNALAKLYINVCHLLNLEPEHHDD